MLRNSICETNGKFRQRKLLNVEGTDTCGVHSVDTKSEIVKILHFKQFYRHYAFNEDGDGGRKKVLKIILMFMFVLIWCVEIQRTI